MYQQPTLVHQNTQNLQQGQVKIIGNYQYNLRYCLGEGAYGKVYEGTDTKTNKKIAIKKLDIKSFERDNYLRNQIISEIEILKRFNHRNIVQFIDLITTQRSLYIITEYCANGDLRQLMQHKRLNEDQCIKILRHIVEGFKELIKHQVIHRDLKPANILCHDGVFKIADFGFAKFVDYSSAQLLRSCVGSPLYMAPQILQRKQYGTKCDIWSMGVIFHEMLFHDVPWKARDERELLNNIMTQPYKIRVGAKIGTFAQEILKRTLVVDESKRIGWDTLFDMFKDPEPAKVLSNDNISNKENINQKPVGAVDNKIRKSIFDKQEVKATSENIMKVENKFNNATPAMTQAQLQKIQQTEQFNQKNGKRVEINFKHFVCVDLFTKMQKNKVFVQKELIYEQFLIVLAFQVKQQSISLVKQVKEMEHRNEEFFKNSKELQALAQSIQKEQAYYTVFFDDIVDNFNIQGITDNLKSEKDLKFVFQLTSVTQEELTKLEQHINVYGKDVCQFMSTELKKRPLEESLRPMIMSVDFILDVILSQKKLMKGQDVNFDQMQVEKSEQFDLKHYMSKVQDKFGQLQSSYSFF